MPYILLSFDETMPVYARIDFYSSEYSFVNLATDMHSQEVYAVRIRWGVFDKDINEVSFEEIMPDDVLQTLYSSCVPVCDEDTQWQLPYYLSQTLSTAKAGAPYGFLIQNDMALEFKYDIAKDAIKLILVMHPFD